MDTVSKLSFCAVFSFTYSLFKGIIGLTSTEDLFPSRENLKYLFILRTFRSRFPFYFHIQERGDHVPIREILLFTIAGGGLLMDLLQEKVDNRLICLGFGSGLILNIFYSGFTGILHFFSGAFFPLLCLLPLFFFRMIGGGDIKLLSALGGILGYPKILSLLLLTFLTGAILSLAFLISCGNLKERISYFISYFYSCRRNRSWKPYRRKGLEPENFHFTVSIFAGIILLTGGVCY